MNIGPIKTGDLITVYGHPDNDVPKNEDFDGTSGLCLGYALDGMAGTVEIIVQFPDTFTIFSAHWDEDLNCYVYFPSRYDGDVEWRICIKNG